MEILLLILGLLLFVALVVVHEFGHFIVARRNGVHVEEFGLGFPPKIKTLFKDSKGTRYTLNLLPLGGFVRLKGEHDADKCKGAYGSVRLWSKTKIILAGVAMNLVTAWVMFTILALVGIPRLPLPDGSEQFTVQSDTKILSNKVLVGYVEPGGPADKAGVKTGDRIDLYGQIVNPKTGKLVEHCVGECVANAERAADIRKTTESLLKIGVESIPITVSRNNTIVDATLTPRTLNEVADSEKTDNPKGYLGIQPYDYTIQRSTWSAPIVGAGLIVQFSKLTYSALGSTVVNLFKGHASEASQNVSGPVGIFVVLKDGASLGLGYIFLIIALLSLTLAIMNTLPIPALDGGKLAVTYLFRAIRRELKPRTEEYIHGTGFMVLMLVFVLITFVDVRRFF